jgi:hypothetical protein
MKAAWRRIALLTGVSLHALGVSARSSDDLVTCDHLRRLRRAGAL